MKDKMTDNDLWAVAWKWFTILIVGISVTIGSCSYKKTETRSAALVEMVKAGANPAQASCAINDDNQMTACIILAAKQ